MAKRSEHEQDFYVREARKSKWRSRAAFKLIEIDQKDHLLNPEMIVVDLGAAPGSWSQYAQKKIGTSGEILAIDRLPMEPIKGVKFIQGDFLETATLEKVLYELNGKKVDLILSDMAPNITGNALVDQHNGLYLIESALCFAQKTLALNGSFLIKLFQGSETHDYIMQLKPRFKKLVYHKPKASRDRSKEIYISAKQFLC